MNKYQKQILKELEGQEILLSPYGAVMIENNNFIYNGKSYKIDNSNYSEIYDAYILQEYGTTDLNEIINIEKNQTCYGMEDGEDGFNERIY